MCTQTNALLCTRSAKFSYLLNETNVMRNYGGIRYTGNLMQPNASTNM